MTAEPVFADAGEQPRRMPMGTTCAVHVHREWVPVVSHHIWPEGMGGPNVVDNRVTVCCNGHYSIHALLDLLIKHDGVVPWATRRRFGRKVRRYAQRGYDESQAARLSGG